MILAHLMFIIYIFSITILFFIVVEKIRFNVCIFDILLFLHTLNAQIGRKINFESEECEI